MRNAVFNGGSIWFSFATSDRPGPTVAAEAVGVARWYQLDPVTAGLVQKGNFAVASVHHSYPAIVPDVHGNAALVVGRSSSSELVSVQVTARRASDPPNQLPASRPLHVGLAVHDHNDTGGRNRWGDYHAAALDPTDGVTNLGVRRLSDLQGGSGHRRRRPACLDHPALRVAPPSVLNAVSSTSESTSTTGSARPVAAPPREPSPSPRH